MMSVEQQVRTLVRAWPIPDRTERGDEIVGTTLDLLPDGQSRLTMALAFNLVLGGLRARWRMRPPPVALALLPNGRSSLQPMAAVDAQ